jgi:TatD DNase family protein
MCPIWIDSHCHLDAPEFDADRADVVQRARAAGVALQVLPAVAADHFDGVVALAHAHGLAYALGIHPLWTDRAAEGDLDRLADALRRHRDDPRLVAVGEIGLDHFVPGLDRARQERFYRAQLKLARDAGLPVILHVRRSADALLAGLNRIEVPGGIAHAFNGSDQQAARFVERGFRLGFGGTLSFEPARQIRHLAQTLPMEARPAWRRAATSRRNCRASAACWRPCAAWSPRLWPPRRRPTPGRPCRGWWRWRRRRE